MNGIELLQLIKAGKIKNDTIISVYYDDEDLGKTLIKELHYIDNECFGIGGSFDLSYLYNDSYSFQIVEADIEELNLDTDILLENVVITTQEYVIESKINELVEAVNKLKNKG